MANLQTALTFVVVLLVAISQIEAQKIGDDPKYGKRITYLSQFLVLRGTCETYVTQETPGYMQMTPSAACDKIKESATKTAVDNACSGNVKYADLKNMLCNAVVLYDDTNFVNTFNSYYATLRGNCLNFVKSELLSKAFLPQSSACDKIEGDADKTAMLTSCTTDEYDGLKAIICSSSNGIGLGISTMILCALIHVYRSSLSSLF